jgi:hypothetical protein
MKPCIALLFLFPILLQGQISSGWVSFVTVDSVLPKPNARTGSGYTDTVVAIVSGIEQVIIIDDSNRAFPYEKARDTLEYYFTKRFVVSRERGGSFYRVFDLKARKRLNIVKERGVLRLGNTYDMYVPYWEDTYTTAPQVLLTPSVVHGGNLPFSCQAESYALKTSDNHTIYSIEICTTQAILMPLSGILGYPKDILACPVWYARWGLEQSSHWRLLAYEKIEEASVVSRLEEGLRQYLPK